MVEDCDDLPRRQLLRQHRLGVSLILLRPVQRLRIGFQLRIQTHQNFQIVLFVSRKLSHILLLERRQFVSISSRLFLASSNPFAQNITGAARRRLN